jgi:hypothetical protein
MHYRRVRLTGVVGTVGKKERSRVPNSDGYIYIWDQSANRAEHIVIAERVLGKPLPAGAEVHHVDEDRANNANGNLVICQDKAYHKLLHIRTAALDACGNANWRRCHVCKRYDAPENLFIGMPTTSYHRSCNAAREAARKARSIASPTCSVDPPTLL